jgi:hypothetical protein
LDGKRRASIFIMQAARKPPSFGLPAAAAKMECF